MSIQLKKLAVLDVDSGEQFVSKENKARYVYKEKPLTVKVGSGQNVIESYEYGVSISGLISKSDSALLDKLSASETNVRVSGYTDSGLVLQGSGKVVKDGTSYLIKSFGDIGYKDDGTAKFGMSLAKNMAVMTNDWPEVYFPFKEEVQASFWIKSGGNISIVARDENGDVIMEVSKKYDSLGRHAFKDKKSISVQLPEGVRYVSVVREGIIADNLSLTIK